MSHESDPPPSPNGTPTAAPAADVRPEGEKELCEVSLQNPCRYPEAGARRHRAWLESLVAELAPAAASLAVRFVSDREMRHLNATYRQIDRPTDVLSFPDEPEAHLGDIAISVPTARRQARERGHEVERELRTLMLHGVLHCLGHDHETDDGTMERLERRYRRRFIDAAWPAVENRP